MQVKLGQRARDTITGYEGVVIARTEWLYGCVRITVQARALKDGKPVDAYCFDEPQAEVLETVQPEPTEARHGGRPSATRAIDPSR